MRIKINVHWADSHSFGQVTSFVVSVKNSGVKGRQMALNHGKWVNKEQAVTAVAVQLLSTGEGNETPWRSSHLWKATATMQQWYHKNRLLLRFDWTNTWETLPAKVIKDESCSRLTSEARSKSQTYAWPSLNLSWKSSGRTGGDVGEEMMMKTSGEEGQKDEKESQRWESNQMSTTEDRWVQARVGLLQVRAISSTFRGA